MATSTDFPSTCSTNAILLQDFGEVAYIVCTVAIPPTSNAVQAAPFETTIARLKQTEAQFRNASILASLEAEAFQLFTFYKKVDVMKDQRTLLAKFGTILRNNSCTISYKAAVRAPDLLKLEQAKLYRLFISAILASVKIPRQDYRQILALGQRYHILEHGVSELGRNSTLFKPWTLIRTDVQLLVKSGHVLLTMVVDTSKSLFTIVDDHSQRKTFKQSQTDRTPVVLAPCGQLATYQAGWIGSWAAVVSGTAGLEPESVERLKSWRSLITRWASSDRDFPFEDGDEELWVQLQVPQALAADVAPTETEHEPDPQQSRPTHAYEFKPMFWPAKFCFVLRNSEPVPMPDRIGPEDPVTFVQDWIDAAKERREDEERAKKAMTTPEDDDDDLFADENVFDGREPFQSLGPPAFAAGQMVYPTPPDVVMTHTTPGMSSVDGTAMTPANGPRVTGDVLPSSSQEHEMIDANQSHAAAVGTGLYDEDLFEDMPDDNFDDTGAVAEPNWDFFDTPDMNMDPSGALETNDQREDSSDTVNGGSRKHVNVESVSTDDAVVTTQGATAGISPVAARDGLHAENQDLQNNGTEPFPDVEASVPPPHADGVIQRPSPQLSPMQRSERRRSSIYETPRPSAGLVQHDSRYRTQGAFWFDTSTGLTSKKRPHHLVGWTGRSPSPSSASETSTSDGSSPEGDHDARETVKPWTVYTPASPQEDPSTVQVDINAINQESREMFDCIKVKSTIVSLEHTPFISKKSGSTMPRDKLVVNVLIAQLFVDQYAQSALARSLRRGKPSVTDARTMTDSVPSVTNSNLNEAYASIGQLSSMNAAPGHQDGRLLKLPEDQIRFKRGDKDMAASTSIIPFWDTLGLQPQAKAKDVTGFCIYLPGSGTADGSASFMERIADAYGNSSLGLHKIGKLLNWTDNGLVAWSQGRGDKITPGLFARALAQASDITGPVLLYIMAPSADPTSYIQYCMAFWAFFTQYRQAAKDKINNDVELVLQIIPAPFIASPETIVVPDQRDYNSLAREVYGRLPPSDSNSPAGVCEFPLNLADPTDSVRFNLESQPVSPYTKDGACLHLAYSHSRDPRYIVACWTDERGRLNHTVAYLLKGQVQDKGRPEADIIKDMWEVSQDLMKSQRSRWRLIVSRIGFYEIAEENMWKHLANSEATEQKPHCTLQLVSIELDPALQMSGPADSSKHGQRPGSSQPNTYGTPGSTPQATTSPEQLFPATPTPGGSSAITAATPPEQGFDANIEAELRLVDPCEESWAMVLLFGMNQSYNIFEVRPALASGYLLKRLGPKDEDGLSSVGVHLKHASELTPNALNQHEDILADILRQFRGLATLAMARGVIDKGKQAVPWHIHTAATGATGLCGLM